MDKICPYCHGGGFMMSKAKMVVEILKMVGFPEKKSVYADGTMNREETFAVFSWIRERNIKERRQYVSKSVSNNKTRSRKKEHV